MEASSGSSIAELLTYYWEPTFRVELKAQDFAAYIFFCCRSPSDKL
jgi:hypothetical protein